MGCGMFYLWGVLNVDYCKTVNACNSCGGGGGATRGGQAKRL